MTSSANAPVGRIIMGEGTIYQALLREENLSSAISQLHLYWNSGALSGGPISPTVASSRLLKHFDGNTLLEIDSVLIFPCMGTLADGTHGDSIQTNPLIFSATNEDSPFTKADTRWAIEDFIDSVGSYVIHVTSIEVIPGESLPSGKTELEITGTLVHHLEPCVPVAHSILTDAHFNVGLTVKWNVANMICEPPIPSMPGYPPDRFFFGSFVTARPAFTDILRKRGIIPLKAVEPTLKDSALNDPKAVHRATDGERIFCTDKKNFNQERLDSAGFLRAYACIPEKKSLLVLGVPDEHRVTEEAVTTCMARIEAADDCHPSFLSRSLIPRVKEFPFYKNKAKLLILMKWNFAIYNLEAYSPVDHLPSSHSIDFAKDDHISFFAMLDGLRMGYVLMFHEGYDEVFKSVRDDIERNLLTTIPDKVLYVCLILSLADVCTVIHDNTKKSDSWRLDQQKIPNLLKASLAKFFNLTRCLDMWRTWDEKYEGKYTMPSAKRPSPTPPAVVDPTLASPSKKTKNSAIKPSPGSPDFCLHDVQFNYKWQTRKSNTPGGKAMGPCPGRGSCITKHIQAGSFPPKADVIAWLLLEKQPGVPPLPHLKKLATHIDLNF